MEIRKAAEAASSGAPTAAQLEAINALAKTRLNGEQVYVFSLRLCDDRIDRDGERFDTGALPGLAKLFLGKTGILDHRWSTENQVARIFETQVVKEKDASYIRAWACLLRPLRCPGENRRAENRPVPQKRRVPFRRGLRGQNFPLRRLRFQCLRQAVPPGATGGNALPGRPGLRGYAGDLPPCPEGSAGGSVPGAAVLLFPPAGEHYPNGGNHG